MLAQMKCILLVNQYWYLNLDVFYLNNPFGLVLFLLFTCRVWWCFLVMDLPNLLEAWCHIKHDLILVVFWLSWKISSFGLKFKTWNPCLINISAKFVTTKTLIRRTLGLSTIVRAFISNSSFIINYI